MSQRIVVAVFAHEDDLLSAAAALRHRGLRIVDAFTPYAVHGLDRALGLAPSRLPWVCLVCGLAGAFGMLWFQHWSAAINWPIDVGGKPWNSLPSDVPVAFEAAVLLAGFGSVFALLGVSRLFPGKQPQLLHPRITDDRFVLVIDQTDAAFELGDVERILQEFRVVEVEERLALAGGSHR
jgi:hypothetical protein